MAFLIPVIQASIAGLAVIAVSAIILKTAECAIFYFLDYKTKEQRLVEACWKLCNDINDRYPDKNPHEWRCPYMKDIATLIKYTRQGYEYGKSQKKS